MAHAELRVDVVFSPAPGEVRGETVALASGATVREALEASGLLRDFPTFDVAEAGVGVWGRLASMDDVLRHRDRVEVYRGLQVDPKEARRRRQGPQGFKRRGRADTGKAPSEKKAP